MDKNLPPIASSAGFVHGWKSIPIFENYEPLVPVGFGSAYPLYTSSIYFGERLDSPYFDQAVVGSMLTICVRQSLAAQLASIEAALPPGLHLVAFDGYRPLMVQTTLYQKYITYLQQLHPGWTAHALRSETQKYVSLPSAKHEQPSPHSTGGAVDVALYTLSAGVEEQLQTLLQTTTQHNKPRSLVAQRAKLLIAQHAQLLNFGTPFDHGGPEAALAFFENKPDLTQHEIAARNNRRLLFSIMTAHGLEPYADEWWHYNSRQSQMGAVTSGQLSAAFGGSEPTAKIIIAEQQRQAEWHAARRQEPHFGQTRLLRAATIIPTLRNSPSKE